MLLLFVGNELLGEPQDSIPWLRDISGRICHFLIADRTLRRHNKRVACSVGENEFAPHRHRTAPVLSWMLWQAEE
jgi:hypothetical protein